MKTIIDPKLRKIWKTRTILTILLLSFFILFILQTLLFKINNLFIWALYVVLGLIIIFLVYKERCPKCKKRIWFSGPYELFGLAGFHMLERCPHCGEILKK